MNLETVLKQRKFKTAEERAIVNIIFTAYRINDSHNILRILRGQHPASMSVHLLHDRMLDKNSGVSRMVEKLRAKGYVARDVNTADRPGSNIASEVVVFCMIDYFFLCWFIGNLFQ